MVCYYRSSFLDLPVALVDYQMKGCELRLHHDCQGEYVAMHEIDIVRAELNICRGSVDELWMGGKPGKLNKVQHSTVYRTDELEEDKEEVEGTVLGDGGYEVSIVPFVYPRGEVSVSLLDCFSSVDSSPKSSHPSLPFYVGARHIQDYLKKKRGRKQKIVKSQQEKARREERMKRDKVIFRAKLVVG